MLFSINSGLLEACVLALLMQSDSYGYKLTQDIKKRIPISESTLYPVLRRLQAQAFLETYDKSIEGRVRKYYRITPEGRMQHKRNIAEWTEFKHIIDTIFSGEEK